MIALQQGSDGPGREKDEALFQLQSWLLFTDPALCGSSPAWTVLYVTTLLSLQYQVAATESLLEAENAAFGF